MIRDLLSRSIVNQKKRQTVQPHLKKSQGVSCKHCKRVEYRYVTEMNYCYDTLECAPNNYSEYHWHSNDGISGGQLGMSHSL